MLLGIVSLLIGTAFAETVLFVDSPFLALGLATYLRALWAFSNPYDQLLFTDDGGMEAACSVARFSGRDEWN